VCFVVVVSSVVRPFTIFVLTLAVTLVVVVVTTSWRRQHSSTARAA
jgi:hypothetical protein